MKIHPASFFVFLFSLLIIDSTVVLCTACALLIHEAAHLVVMRIWGIKNCMIEITPFGCMIDAKALASSNAGKMFFCVLAGVAASGAAALACIRFAPYTPFWYCFFCANASLAIVNFLPAWPLDGARLIHAAAICIGKEHLARKLLFFMTWLTGSVFLVLGLYAVWTGVWNVSLLLIGPYMFYAAGCERVAHRVRVFQNRDNELLRSFLLPVSLWVGKGMRITDLSGLFLGRVESGCYGLYVELDPFSNKVRKIWTEEEIRARVFEVPEIDGAKT